jgi:mannose-6-phosphate isomerase-like protein (cupin superfamily)
MTDSGSAAGRPPVVRGPGEGRAYPMGRISAVFKADGAETADRYSISEWWLEPHTKGPGAHSHPEDDVFYVLAGTMSVLVDTEWMEAATGRSSSCPGTSPTILRTAGRTAPECSTSRPLATSSNICRALRSGSPSIRPETPEPEPADVRPGGRIAPPDNLR